MTNPSHATPLIDTHCHLDGEYGGKTDADLVREATDAGITHLVTIATDLASFVKVSAISEKYPNVFHTLGIHPHEAETTPDGYLDQLRTGAEHPKCRAIGEIGLDYHYDHSPRDIQRRVFNEQLDLALEVKLPIVIHSREGESDLLEGLERYCAKLPAGQMPGIIHCFTGTQAFGLRCIELGMLISFSGILTFKKAEDLHECARAFPLESLLVETDSPFLAPIPYRGKKCEPHMVRMTAQKLAELKGITLDEVARVTTANAKRVFAIT